MVFKERLNRIMPKLKGIIYKINRPCAIFNEQDLCQEALMYLWQQFQNGELEDKTDSYLLQGCYFYLKNYLRTSGARKREISLEEIALPGDSSLDEILCLKDESSEDSLNYLNCKMFAETIRNNGLTKREKDILFLYAEGLTTREIGQRVRLSHVRVVRLIAEIKEKCKKYTDKF